MDWKLFKLDLLFQTFCLLIDVGKKDVKEFI